jgi:tRNA(Ile)-lysidine synthetase-like protein
VAALADPGDLSVTVEGPGRVDLPAFGLVLEVGIDLGRPADGPPVGALLIPTAPTPDAPLVVRNVLPGDRVGPKGARRKVSDLLVDQKVPRHRRRRMPLVVADGEIVWIPGIWQKRTPPEELFDGACGLAFSVRSSDDGDADGSDE